MNEIYRDTLSRSAFHAGLQEMRRRLKEYVRLQRELKEILHKPHTRDTWKHQTALFTQRCAISALLDAYLFVRGKEAQHRSKKHWHYNSDYTFAMQCFDDAVRKQTEKEAAEVAEAAH